MATTYHLRPISVGRSASPSTSTSTTSDNNSPPLPPYNRLPKAIVPSAPPAYSPIPTGARPRRPLSPSSLRDLDLPLDYGARAPGPYPAPPTGHELMALFPPKPPAVAHGNTSGFFGREERKYFAQAGREIVRVRMELDSPAPAPVAQRRGPPPPYSARPPTSSVSPPAGKAPVIFAAPPPPPGYPQQQQQDAMAMVTDEGEEDEAWRRPTPHNARRRAGKHTRRVVVK